MCQSNAGEEVGGDDGGVSSPDAAAKLDGKPGAKQDTAAKKDTNFPPPADVPPPSPGSFRFAVYGDTRTQHQVHTRVLTTMATFSPKAVLHTGDLEESYDQGTLSTWLDLVNQHRVYTDLINQRLFLVARGNHDGNVNEDSRWPTLTRQSSAQGTSEQFYLMIDRAFVVVMGYDPDDPNYLAAALSRAEAKSARWRFVTSHLPVYDSGAVHRNNGIQSVERLCDQYGVDVFFSGHEHLHERSFQMKAGKVVDRGDALKAGAGTIYVVEGAGGAPIYPVDSPLPSSRFYKSVHGFQVVDMDDNRLSFATYDLDGKLIDSFLVNK